MRGHRRALGAAALALAALLSLPACAQDRPARGLIVKLRELPAADGADAAAERVRRVAAEAGLAPLRLRPVGRRGMHLDFDRLLDGAQAARMAQALRARPEVEWVVPNEREQRLQVPTDPLFAQQWWLRPVSGSNANAIADRLRGVPGLQSAWVGNTGNAAALVAVLDTGITCHPDLGNDQPGCIGGAILPGYDFVSVVEYANDGNGRDADPRDPGDWVSDADRTLHPALFGDCQVDNSTWHGTVIAGIVAGLTDNGLGTAAINWNGRVLPVRVAGKCGAEVADIVDGMRWAAGLAVAGAPPNANPARIVNISFGGSAACNPAYQDAIDELRAVGAVVVAAAGNDHGALKRPANCRGVIGVVALNRDGFKANYSSFGAQAVIATVGGDPRGDGAWGMLLGDDGLLTLENGGLRDPGSADYGSAYGTSFAAPVVSGVLSLMLSVEPALTSQQLIDGLRLSSRPHVGSPTLPACSDQNPGRCLCSTSICGAGILDAPQALLYAQSPASYVRPAQSAALIDHADLEAALRLGADLPPNPGAISTTVASATAGGGAWGVGWLAALGIAILALIGRGGRPNPGRSG